MRRLSTSVSGGSLGNRRNPLEGHTHSELLFNLITFNPGLRGVLNSSIPPKHGFVARYAPIRIEPYIRPSMAVFIRCYTSVLMAIL